MFSEKLNGAAVTAGPALAPSTSNCTLVVLADALVVTAMVPETVAPEAGEVTETVGAGLVGAGLFAAALLTSALVPPPQPPQSSAATNIKHNQAAAHAWALDLHASLVGELIESSWLSLNGRLLSVISVVTTVLQQPDYESDGGGRDSNPREKAFLQVFDHVRPNFRKGYIPEARL